LDTFGAQVSSDHERYPADVKCLGFLYLYVGRYPRNNASRNTMASGLPVIVTPGCNLPEVASWDAGLVVEPSVEAVVAGLWEMFGEPSRMRKRGENGRALVRHRFTWPRIARDTLAVYGEMIRDGNRTVA
ncbi:MAG: hypothetical protein BECKG1743D_GA0114223_109392, partial [Candidatus Kentron sp. G]